MSVAKTIEITAESPDSFGAAIEAGIERAAETIDGIKSAWIEDQVVLVDGTTISGYRVRLKVTFALNRAATGS
jgi:flavin-binding protein dodecin